MKKFSLLFSFLAIILLTGCKENVPSDTQEPKPPLSSDSETMSNPAETQKFDQTSLPEKGEEIAIISTSLGDMKVRFFKDKAPKTVENFVTHAKNKYYDGIIFHRVIDRFMIQGGDPDGNGTGGESIWGGPFADEFHADLKNIPYSISMANAGPNTNGSQFFINQVDNQFLNNRHTVFGQVFEGMETVEKIAKVKKAPGDKPLEDIPMKIEIVTYEG